ncbi:hypothetical protein SARC_04434 [Sphaeroforma arctica JP610]|uniref:Disease resistance R13L4/SHOC-2-like LRR domain-containing protein n=1 Tax=Sphaeroforma arctica JP610 TaxID=667725 RepID=A0A0L0G368_9EUKA|nr:hypothetical protein SARC_04434 [Sphaeroforma arctica JP610]KNC83309.1 hypothetical protein SARC_04434 [Sphaeroforma arctica JP610]|eukprot:XP_014157211.1 hypothetical protein SARC_04434 [Sphaeroforma arctica JP610]
MFTDDREIFRKDPVAEQYDAQIEKLGIRDLFSAELKFLDLSGRTMDDDLKLIIDTIQDSLLPRLNALMLNDNGLRSLPEAVLKKSSVSILYAAQNELVSLAGVGALKSLKFLTVDNNQIAAIPASISKCKNLKSLYAQDNNISELPPEIECLSNLEALYLANNQITDLPESLRFCKKLDGASLRGNLLSRIPSVLFELRKLKTLHLSRNAITEVPEIICNLQALKILDLRHNKITRLPENIGRLQALKLLDCSYNSLVELPSSIGDLRNLEQAFFEHNVLEALPKEMGQLSNLREVNFSNNNLKFIPMQIGMQAMTLSATFGGNPFPTAQYLRRSSQEKPPMSAISLRDAAYRQILTHYRDTQVIKLLPPYLGSRSRMPCDVCRAPAFQDTNKSLLVGIGVDRIVLPCQFVVCSDVCALRAKSRSLAVITPESPL